LPVELLLLLSGWADVLSSSAAVSRKLEASTRKAELGAWSKILCNKAACAIPAWQLYGSCTSSPSVKIMWQKKYQQGEKRAKPHFTAQVPAELLGR
jgi:hypothetical protein